MPSYTYTLGGKGQGQVVMTSNDRLPKSATAYDVKPTADVDYLDTPSDDGGGITLAMVEARDIVGRTAADFAAPGKPSLAARWAAATPKQKALVVAAAGGAAVAAVLLVRAVVVRR